MRKTLILLSLAFFVFTFNAGAQPRPIEAKPTPKAEIKPAPPSFTAKYEGGMFGYSKKEEGTLKFDDINERLVFFGADQKEKFAIPYDAMLVIYPQSQSVRSTAGTVVSVIGGGPLGNLIREKRRYLIVHYQDVDVDAKGAVNFKIEDKDLLDSVLATLADKAEMSQRGDAYYKKRKTAVKKDDNQ
jgi:hypothetical protein